MVELMVTIAIIGVLGSLAALTVMKYLAHSKSAEAKSMVGAISRASHAAFERGRDISELTAEGTQSTRTVRRLCGSSAMVPTGLPPAGKKYQPDTSASKDYNVGDSNKSWKCLRYETSQAHYFQYKYTNGLSLLAPSNPALCSGGLDSCYEAAARGDLIGDGQYLRIARTGSVNPVTGVLKASTVLYVSSQGCSTTGSSPGNIELLIVLGLLWLGARRREHNAV